MELEVYRCDRLQTDINPRNRDVGTQCDFSLFAFGQKKRCAAVKSCTRARAHAIFGCARSWHVGGVVAWIPRVACCKTLQLVAALSCVQLGGVIVSFKMYWKIAFVSYLFHFSGLMVLKGEYKTLSGGSYFNFVVDFEVSDFSTFLQRTHLKLAA